MSYHQPWPEERCVALRFHLLGGNLSYSGIAVALNNEFGTHYSRNSMIGKASRLGLSNSYMQKLATLPKKPKKQQPYKPRPKRQPMFVQAGEYVATECSEILPRNLTLIELEPNDCRWPYGENQDMRFCGHSQLEGSKYCWQHFNLSLRRNG
jgi:GcrA cell cycle regulator